MENAGGLGRHLAVRLASAGESVVDAPPKLSARVRVEEALEEWPASQLSRVQSTYSAIILAYEEGLSLSRATPMPSS